MQQDMYDVIVKRSVIPSAYLLLTHFVHFGFLYTRTRCHHPSSDASPLTFNVHGFRAGVGVQGR